MRLGCLPRFCGPFAALATFLPSFYSSLPLLKLQSVTRFPLQLDSSKQLLGRLKLVFVLFAQLGRELAFEGVLEHGLAIDIELRLRRLEALNPLVKFGKQFLNLGDDAALFS